MNDSLKDLGLWILLGSLGLLVLGIAVWLTVILLAGFFTETAYPRVTRIFYGIRTVVFVGFSLAALGVVLSLLLLVFRKQFPVTAGLETFQVKVVKIGACERDSSNDSPDLLDLVGMNDRQIITLEPTDAKMSLHVFTSELVGCNKYHVGDNLHVSRVDNYSDRVLVHP